MTVEKLVWVTRWRREEEGENDAEGGRMNGTEHSGEEKHRGGRMARRELNEMKRTED